MYFVVIIQFKFEKILTYKNSFHIKIKFLINIINFFVLFLIIEMINFNCHQIY